MGMLKIYDENYLFNNTVVGESFRPKENFLLLIQSGSLEISTIEGNVIYQSSRLIFIYADKEYTFIDHSDNLNLVCVYINRLSIQDKMNFDFSTYDAYRLIGVEREINEFPIEKKSFEHLWSLVKHLQFYSDEKQSRFREQVILNILSTIIYILVELLFEGLKFDNIDKPREEELTLDFLKLLSQHYKTKRNLKFYAEEMNVSVKYLSISVKSITGYPPSVFIAKSTLGESKRLLLHTKATISSIAYELSFSDPYSFGKFFKKHTAFSPTHYRKKMKTVHTI